MKKILMFVMAIILLFSLAACAKTEITVNQEVNESSESKQTAQESTEPETTPEPMPGNVEHVNILLLGSSGADLSDGNVNTYALTHLLVTLDPENRALKFTSFPYNLVIGVETENGVESGQLQFICSNLGPDGTVEVLEKNFGITIDHWVLMNMSGVAGIVDAIDGIEINVERIAINDLADYIEGMLGLAWEEITQTGLQVLNGIQASGYFMDTMYDSPDAQEEEMRFREHHENIINGVAISVKTLGLGSEDLISIATSMMENYATNIPDQDWKMIADSAIYCLGGNDPQYLHIPQAIETDEWDIIFDHETDVAAVQEFVQE